MCKWVWHKGLLTSILICIYKCSSSSFRVHLPYGNLALLCYVCVYVFFVYYIMCLGNERERKLCIVDNNNGNEKNKNKMRWWQKYIKICITFLGYEPRLFNLLFLSVVLTLDFFFTFYLFADEGDRECTHKSILCVFNADIIFLAWYIHMKLESSKKNEPDTSCTRDVIIFFF